MEKITIKNINLKEKLNEIAISENIEANVIIDIALKFYLALPLETQQLLNSFDSYSEETKNEEIIRQVIQSLLNSQYQNIEKQVIKEIKIDDNISLSSEDDILNYAVSLTSH